MVTLHQNTAWVAAAGWILLVSIVDASPAVVAVSRPPKATVAEARDTRLPSLTTKAGVDRKEKAGSPARQFQRIHAQNSDVWVRDLKFTHLTTNDGLSQSNVTAILQDRRGFMWF